MKTLIKAMLEFAYPLCRIAVALEELVTLYRLFLSEHYGISPYPANPVKDDTVVSYDVKEPEEDVFA